MKTPNPLFKTSARLVVALSAALALAAWWAQPALAQSAAPVTVTVAASPAAGPVTLSQTATVTVTVTGPDGQLVTGPAQIELTVVVNAPTAAPTLAVAQGSRPAAAPAAAAPAAAGGPRVAQQVNLRGGPGTSFAIVGNLQPGAAFTITGRNADSSWYQVDAGGSTAWVAAFLVLDAPAADSTPVVGEAAAAPAAASEAAPAAAPTAAPAATPQTGSKFAELNEWVEGGGWRYKISEVHKLKTLYLYDESYVAMGNWLVLVFDAVNLQPGSDYFANNMIPVIADQNGEIYVDTSKATRYASWQFGGLGDKYDDMTPGRDVRFVVAFDMPDSAGVLMFFAHKDAKPIFIGLNSEIPVEE